MAEIGARADQHARRDPRQDENRIVRIAAAPRLFSHFSALG
jgi:hypothetical protein